MPHVHDATTRLIPAVEQHAVGGVSRMRAAAGGLWPFLLVLAVPVALYLVNPAWLYTPPGWLDSWVPVGLGLNYTDPTIANADYKISRLPWNLLEFIVRHSLRENLAQIVLQFSLIAASVAAAARIGRMLLQPLGGYVLMLMMAAFPLVTAAAFRGGSDYQNALAFPLFLTVLATLSSITAGNGRRVGLWVGVAMSSLLCVDTMYVQMLPYVVLLTAAVMTVRGMGPRELRSLVKWVILGGGACVASLMVVHAAVGRGFFFFLPEWRFVLSMLGNSAKDVWWQPLDAAALRGAPHLAFLFVSGAVALVEVVWLAALDQQADARRVQLAIHGGFLIELAIWTGWQLFGHHTTLLPVYFAHPLYGPACLSIAAVVSRHVGAVDRRLARGAMIALPLTCFVALVGSAQLLAGVRARDGAPFAVSALMLLALYGAMALVRALRHETSAANPVLAGTAQVCAVVLLLPLTFASTAPGYLYAPTPCRFYPDFNRFVIESSHRLQRQTPHATSVFVWASPDDTMAVSPPCRPFWTGEVEDVAISFMKLSHTYLYDWKPHMTPAAGIPSDRLRRIGADPDSVVAVVASDRRYADILRARFESAGVAMTASGQLRAGTRSELPSIFLLVPVDARIAADISTQLKTNPATASSDIDVTVDHGVARLSGLADSDAARQRAVALARGAKGVTDVASHIGIRTEVIQDVRAALASDPLVGRIPIDVRALHTTITLVSDKTNQEQRTRALELARAAAGVIPVEDHMK